MVIVVVVEDLQRSERWVVVFADVLGGIDGDARTCIFRDGRGQWCGIILIPRRGEGTGRAGVQPDLVAFITGREYNHVYKIYYVYNEDEDGNML